MAKSALKLFWRGAKKSNKFVKLSKKKEAEEQKRVGELVAKYMPYASSIANRVSQTLASNVEYDDVLCCARLGLIEAARRYDGSQDVDFRTFAYYRIRGAVYDGLRRSGWLPRSLYARLKYEEAANDYLKYSSERSSYSNDVAVEQEIHSTVNALASIYVISLDGGENEIEVADEKVVSAEDQVQFHRIRGHMREAINSLPPKERQLIRIYYFQNKTMEEAGDRLKLSKSWTSRLHARALDMLLKRIKTLVAKDKGEQ